MPDKYITGRPAIQITDELVNKLESIFKIGGTVEEACSYALISGPTYYKLTKQDQTFLRKMQAAQHYADVAAKNVVVKSITKDKDVETAKWWLEKREFKQNQQLNIHGEKIAVVITEGEIIHGEEDTGSLPGTDITMAEISEG